MIENVGDMNKKEIESERPLQHDMTSTGKLVGESSLPLLHAQAHTYERNVCTFG